MRAFFLADLGDLVEAVRKRVAKNKIAACVGSGQIGDWPVAESSSYAFAFVFS